MPLNRQEKSDEAVKIRPRTHTVLPKRLLPNRLHCKNHTIFFSCKNRMCSTISFLACSWCDHKTHSIHDFRAFLGSFSVLEGSVAIAIDRNIDIFRRLKYEERAQMAKNPVGRALFELMSRKHTNLSVAADVNTAEEMLALADAVGPHIVVLKTHVDVFDSWTADHARKLQDLADKHGKGYSDPPSLSELLEWRTV